MYSLAKFLKIYQILVKVVEIGILGQNELKPGLKARCSPLDIVVFL